MTDSDTNLSLLQRELKDLKKKTKLGRLETRRMDDVKRMITTNIEKGLSPEEEKTRARQSALRKVRKESGKKFRGRFSTPLREEAKLKKDDIIEKHRNPDNLIRYKGDIFRQKTKAEKDSDKIKRKTRLDKIKKLKGM